MDANSQTLRALLDDHEALVRRAAFGRLTEDQWAETDAALLTLEIQIDAMAQVVAPALAS